MTKMKAIAAILLTLCLAVASALAEEEDYSDIAGEWYTEEVMMTVTEEGRFVLEWNDGDWTGSLEADLRTNEEDEEYTAYRMVLDNPEDSAWENLELVPDIYHPGKMTYYQDGTPLEVFYDVPIYVMDMEGEDLAVYEPYAFIDAANGNEPAVTMMFTFLRPVKDVAVMEMSDQRIDEDGNLGYNGSTLEWWAELDSLERIVVTRVFEGDLPDLSVNFITEDGTGYDFAVQMSGYDGELELLRLAAPNG